MGQTLDLASYTEGQLQAHFDDWSQRRAQRVGTPPWIDGLLAWAPQRTFNDSWGISFRPDTLAHDGSTLFVFELKFARKYEPLALAEALHHAQALSSATAELRTLLGWSLAGAVRPVIVSQFNAWIRDAREYLIAHGFSRDALAVVEVAALRDATGNEWLWFHEVDGPDPWRAIAAVDLPVDVHHALAPTSNSRCFARPGSRVYARIDGGALVPDAYEPRTVQRWIAQTQIARQWLVWDRTSMDAGAYGIVESAP